MQGLYCFLNLACWSVPLQRLAMNRIDLAHFFWKAIYTAYCLGYSLPRASVHTFSQLPLFADIAPMHCVNYPTWLIPPGLCSGKHFSVWGSCESTSIFSMTTIPRQVCPVLLCCFPYSSSLESIDIEQWAQKSRWCCQFCFQQRWLLCTAASSCRQIGFSISFILYIRRRSLNLFLYLMYLFRITVVILLLISGISGKCRNLYQANRFCEPYQLVFHRTEVSIILQMEACM